MFGLMGNCMSRKKSIPRSMVLTITGLDNAGKTTTVKGLIENTLDGVVPTVGFAPYEMKVKKHTVKLIDVGGGKKVRDIWKHYYAESHGLVFIVDASKKDRLDEAKMELRKVVSDSRVNEKPIVVFANKQDSEEAHNEEEIAAHLELENLVNEFKCPTRVIKCTATSGAGRKQDKGIKTGIEWLVGIIEERWDTINEKVTKLVEAQNEVLAKEKEEKKIRVRERRRAREAEEAEQEGEGGDGQQKTPSELGPSPRIARKKSLRDKENEQPALRSSVTFKSTEGDPDLSPRLTASLNGGRTLTSSSISLGDTARPAARKLSPLPPLITATNGPVMSEDGQKKKRKKQKKKPRTNQTSPKYETEDRDEDMELDGKKLPPLREDSEETLHETQESFSDFMGVTARRRGDKSYSFE